MTSCCLRRVLCPEYTYVRDSLPQHPRIFGWFVWGVFFNGTRSAGLSVNWNVFFTYPYMCSMPVDWISKIKSKLVVVLWLFRNSRNSFCSVWFCFVFPRSLFVVLVIIIIFLFPFLCVGGGVGGSLWIMMIRPQTRLSIQADSEPIRPSIHIAIHPTVLSLSWRLDYWFIVCFFGSVSHR